MLSLISKLLCCCTRRSTTSLSSPNVPAKELDKINNNRNSKSIAIVAPAELPLESAQEREQELVTAQAPELINSIEISPRIVDFNVQFDRPSRVANPRRTIRLVSARDDIDAKEVENSGNPPPRNIAANDREIVEDDTRGDHLLAETVALSQAVNAINEKQAAESFVRRGLPEQYLSRGSSSSSRPAQQDPWVGSSRQGGSRGDSIRANEARIVLGALDEVEREEAAVATTIMAKESNPGGIPGISPRFSQSPELLLNIWEVALPGRRILRVDRVRDGPLTRLVVRTSDVGSLREALSANSDSRRIALRHYRLGFGTETTHQQIQDPMFESEPLPEVPPRFRWNPERDIVYLRGAHNSALVGFSDLIQDHDRRVIQNIAIAVNEVDQFSIGMFFLGALSGFPSLREIYLVIDNTQDPNNPNNSGLERRVYSNDEVEAAWRAAIDAHYDEVLAETPRAVRPEVHFIIPNGPGEWEVFDGPQDRHAIEGSEGSAEGTGNGTDQEEPRQNGKGKGKAKATESGDEESDTEVAVLWDEDNPRKDDDGDQIQGKGEEKAPDSKPAGRQLDW